MRIGHVDGRGIIYDDNGGLILEKGEHILRTCPDHHATITTRWRSWGINIAFDGNAGKGTIYVTDKRLVFIRIPNPFETLKQDSTPYALPTGMAKSMRARWILEAGGREYCELRYEDIVGYKRKRWGARFFVIADGEEYSTGADKEILSSILPILKERGIPEWKSHRDRSL